MTEAQRRIDHAVVAVHDLDAAGDFYRRLGFQVGSRNRHPWGTENRLIQFASSFIELITVGGDALAIPDHAEDHFSFGAFVRDYLAAREGLAMLVLDSKDAKADAARYAEAGISAFEPFFFERKGHRPDGRETHVAFTLAFAMDVHMPQASFFVCQQHFPENFWNPAFQRHDNGAIDIAAIGMQAMQPRDHMAFLAAFSGSQAAVDADGSLTIGLRGDARIEVLADPACNTPHLHALSVRIPDLGAQAARLEQQEIAFTNTGNRLTVSPATAFGIGLCFEGSWANPDRQEVP